MALAWQAAARGLFAGCAKLLLVGAKSFGHPGATQLEDVRAAQAVAHGPYDGVLWRVRSELRPGLLTLKPLLEPGAPLLLAVQGRRPPGALFDSLLGRSTWPRYALEDACEALLLLGLSEPRLLASSKGGFAVSARNPHPRSTLDAFFEQPLA